jgi:hypothetical protein
VTQVTPQAASQTTVVKKAEGCELTDSTKESEIIIADCTGLEIQFSPDPQKALEYGKLRERAETCGLFAQPSIGQPKTVPNQVPPPVKSDFIPNGTVMPGNVIAATDASVAPSVAPAVSQSVCPPEEIAQLKAGLDKYKPKLKQICFGYQNKAVNNQEHQKKLHAQTLEACGIKPSANVAAASVVQCIGATPVKENEKITCKCANQSQTYVDQKGCELQCPGGKVDPNNPNKCLSAKRRERV